MFFCNTFTTFLTAILTEHLNKCNYLNVFLTISQKFTRMFGTNASITVDIICV
jgi:hypothetical protein